MPDKFALTQLCGVIALTTLFLVLQGVQVIASGKVDTHWSRVTNDRPRKLNPATI